MAQPDMFGRYRVIRHLGSGAFATVWLAHDDRLDTPVAIKVLAENWARRMDVHQRFMEEARILRQTDSNWLVRVHDLDVLPDERPYMVMTYADQGSVADLVANGPLPLDEALRLLTEIGQGVTVLHRHGTIHRDIKPSNVLLLSSPVGQRVLVADLGFAKSIDRASGFTAAAGTPGYMSPEQSVPGGDIDVRADVYSLGAVAYELITGRPPPSPPVRTPPGRIRPGLPPALDELIMAALSPDRTNRPPDAQAFTDRVRAIRMTPGLPTSVPWWMRHRPKWVRTAAAVLTAAVLMTTTGAAALPGLRFIDVRDLSGRFVVAVPHAWAHQAHGNGWEPRELGMLGGKQPGVLVSTDIGRWRDAGAPSYGVFAGLLPRSAERPGLDELIDSVPCPGKPVRRTVDTERWTGEIREWDECAPRFGAAVLHAREGQESIYVEVRQPDQRPGIVDRVIDGTRLLE
ncbi:serine/threonine-protein kinase [Nocardiopsis rhodophaea]|uniref:serine/threonine-protein kinase n=1 Tax=Nocardiopsis rhodophaea TaxID=280238 RepID=UPI0031D2D1C1